MTRWSVWRGVAIIAIMACAIGATAAWADDAGPGDPAAGRKKIAVCRVCHGVDGRAKIAEAPNLAGQNEQYLVKQLGEFRSGERKNEMMSIVSSKLSDQDIADLAAYYAAIEVSVVPPK